MLTLFSTIILGILALVGSTICALLESVLEPTFMMRRYLIACNHQRKLAEGVLKENELRRDNGKSWVKRRFRYDCVGGGGCRKTFQGVCCEGGLDKRAVIHFQKHCLLRMCGCGRLFADDDQLRRHRATHAGHGGDCPDSQLLTLKGRQLVHPPCKVVDKFGFDQLRSRVAGRVPTGYKFPESVVGSDALTAPHAHYAGFMPVELYCDANTDRCNCLRDSLLKNISRPTRSESGESGRRRKRRVDRPTVEPQLTDVAAPTEELPERLSTARTA